jgi:hypothetical protein
LKALEDQGTLRPATWLYGFTRLVIGGLLALGGGMKLAPWRPLALTWWLVLPPLVVWVVGLAEFVIGTLVLSFSVSRFLWRCCVGAFTAYLLVLAIQLAAGETACQCLGSRSLPILWMLVLDGLLLATLVLLREKWQKPLQLTQGKLATELFSSARFALPVLILMGLASFGSLDAAISYVSGSRLLTRSNTSYVGPLQAGERGTATFKLTNYSKGSIQILGTKTTCKCLAPEDLPLTLAAGESCTLRIGLKAGTYVTPTMQREGATLLCDDPLRLITLTVTASVAAAK